MNIVHVTHLYLPSVGGTEVHTRELSVELTKMGHHVSIYTTDASQFEDVLPKFGHKAERLGALVYNDSGVAINRFHIESILPISLAVKSLFFIGSGMKRLSLIRQDALDYIEAMNTSPVTPKLYLDILRSVDVDVVNSTPFTYGYSLLLNKICQKKDIGFVVTPRAHILSTAYSKSYLLKTAREADAVIALTEGEQSFFVKHNTDKEKVFVTGIGIHPEAYVKVSGSCFKAKHNIPDSSKIVLFLGRLVGSKGIDILIESMRIVWEKFNDVYLVIVGRLETGSPKVEEMIHNYKKALLLTNVSEETKIDALLSSDMLVFPAIYESFGGVFLEAWCAEKPVIGVMTPVTKCVVDDKVNGFLLKSLNKYELAEKIMYLLENEAEAKEMGKCGKKKVLKNYTWEIIAKKTLEVYEYASNK